ncbi:hypothetical protein TYRP_006836 [Tyrophagus putrescentiae]|nr:hypothetical protein TYRP_006836 [Tyrophagus putrescentiae]
MPSLTIISPPPPSCANEELITRQAIIVSLLVTIAHQQQPKSAASAALQPCSSLTYTRSRTKSLETPPADISIPLSPYYNCNSKTNGPAGVEASKLSSSSRSTSSSTSSGIGGIGSSRQVAHLNGGGTLNTAAGCSSSSLRQPSFLATSSLHQLNIAATATGATAAASATGIATTNASAIPMNKMSSAAASVSASSATLNGATTTKLPNHRLIKSQSLRFDSTLSSQQHQRTSHQCVRFVLNVSSVLGMKNGRRPALPPLLIIS